MSAARTMNVHHLELFYYVAKSGGISAAVRRIPYGIQQPAVSGQMGKLEEDVGAKLFERTPFKLTAAGERLFAHVQPFFEGLDGLAGQLREASRPELRIGASELLLRDHVPVVMKRLRALHPRLRLSLQAGHQAQLERWLADGEVDLAICALEARAPARMKRVILARVPMVLLAPKTTPCRDAAEFFRAKKISEPLVGLPAATSVMRSFQRELKRRGIVWPQLVETPTVELVTSYVANGEGIGVSLAALFQKKSRVPVRVWPLDDFPQVAMGVLVRKTPSPLVRTLLDDMRAYALDVWPDWAVKDGAE